MAAWFGEPARLQYLPWEEWCKTVTQEEAQATWDHIAHSPNCSIAKAQRLLDYHPRYSSLQAVQEVGHLAGRAWGDQGIAVSCGVCHLRGFEQRQALPGNASAANGREAQNQQQDDDDAGQQRANDIALQADRNRL